MIVSVYTYVQYLSQPFIQLSFIESTRRGIFTSQPISFNLPLLIASKVRSIVSTSETRKRDLEATRRPVVPLGKQIYLHQPHLQINNFTIFVN